MSSKFLKDDDNGLGYPLVSETEEHSFEREFQGWYLHYLYLFYDYYVELNF